MQRTGRRSGQVAALFLDSDAWRVESLHVKLRNEVADQLGATRGMFHAGTLEIPIRMVQSVGDAVVLSVAAHELREILLVSGDCLQAVRTTSRYTPAPNVSSCTKI